VSARGEICKPFGEADRWMQGPCSIHRKPSGGDAMNQLAIYTYICICVDATLYCNEPAVAMPRRFRIAGVSQSRRQHRHKREYMTWIRDLQTFAERRYCSTATVNRITLSGYTKRQNRAPLLSPRPHPYDHDSTSRRPINAIACS
jgi:hypothetical protein